MPHHTGALSGSPVFRIAAAGAFFAGRRAFRSLDAGTETHGGVLSRWGLGFAFLGVCSIVPGCFCFLFLYYLYGDSI